LSTAGLVLALSIGIGAGAGYWLDLRFGTHWIMLVGFALGVVAGFKEFFKAVSKVIAAEDESDESRRPPRS